MTQPLYHLPSSYDGGETSVIAPNRIRLKQHSRTLPSGRKISYLRGGSGRSVLFIHGFTANSGVYIPNLWRLARQGYEVIAPDLPAHGSTPPLRQGKRDVGSYGELIVELAEYLGLSTVVIIGHSLGARVALEAAVMRPDLFPAFIDLDGIVGAPWDDLMDRPFWKSADRLKALWYDGRETVPRHFGLALQLGNLAKGMLVHDVFHFHQLTQPGMAIFLARPSAPLLEQYRKLGGQTFVIHGEHDYVVPYAVGEDAAQRSGGQLYCVKSGNDVAAHAWPMRCKATFGAWFRGLDLGGTPAISLADYRPKPRFSVLPVELVSA